MNEITLAQAVEAFALTGVRFSDGALEKRWQWGSYDEGARFAFFLTYQELRDLATRTAVQRAMQGPAMTSAQRILAQHHAAYRDLCGLLVGVDEDELDREPAAGEWALRAVLGHIIDVEQGFLTVIRYALDRERSGDGRPLEMPESDDDVEDEAESGEETLKSILANYDALHFQILHELATISEDELDAPSAFWEDSPMEVRFRLHRFDAHLRQHTIQAAKTLAGIGHHLREAERLVRIIYGALGEAEGTRIGAWGTNADGWRDAAMSITQRAGEIAKV
jgi:uncharacterized damage-inducible protein DinB